MSRGLGRVQKEVLKSLAVYGVWSFHGLGGWNHNGSASRTQKVLDSLHARGLVQCRGHALGTYFVTPEGWAAAKELWGGTFCFHDLGPVAIACLAVVLTADELPSDDGGKLRVLHAAGKRLAAEHSHMEPPKKAVYRNLLPNFGLMRRATTYTDSEIVDSVAAGLEMMDEPWRLKQMVAFVRDLRRIVRKRKKDQ